MTRDRVEELKDFNRRLQEADEVMHNVEKEWHYSIMIKYGFKPITKTQKGFVRHYEYQNEKGCRVIVKNGLNNDYWEDITTGKSGYWSSLEPHLKDIYYQEDNLK